MFRQNRRGSRRDSSLHKVDLKHAAVVFQHVAPQCISGLNLEMQLFLELPLQRSKERFAGFDLAAWKLPTAGMGHGRPPAHQKKSPFLVSKDSRNHLQRVHPKTRSDCHVDEREDRILGA